MKTKSLLLVFILASASFLGLSVNQASASDCTANNPCGVWAVLDTQGTVTNVIVCQPSVCGSGTFAGLTVVPQLPANPTTHDATGVGSFNSTPDNPVTYKDERFNVNVETVIVKENVETTLDNETVSKIVIPVKLESFSYQEMVDLQKFPREIGQELGKFNESKPTTISVTKTFENVQESETVQVFERSSASELQLKLQSENLNIILAKFQTVLSLLGNWIKQ
jgi:hypothetical protein